MLFEIRWGRPERIPEAMYDQGSLAFPPVYLWRHRQSKTAKTVLWTSALVACTRARRIDAVADPLDRAFEHHLARPHARRTCVRLPRRGGLGQREHDRKSGSAERAANRQSLFLVWFHE